MKAPAVVAYTHEYLDWQLGEGHPTNPVRARIAVEMLQDEADRVQVDLARVVPILDWDRVLTEARLVHDEAYLADLRAGRNEVWEGVQPRLGEVAALMFAGTLDLVEAMLADRERGRIGVYFNPQGAKHHAMRADGSGFCALNDMAWAAKKLVAAGLKVAYVDWDAHHGDGVEALLAEEPHALTFSIHLGGIFPGTGMDGHDPARGIYNWALARGAGDYALGDAMQEVLHIIRDSRPDVILVACGADGLDGDPLGGLRYTWTGVTKGAAYPLGALAGRLGAPVIVGGAGGYQPFDRTPEAWAQWVAHIYGALAAATGAERRF